MATKINVSKSGNGHIVRVTREWPDHIESRAYFHHATLHTCQAVADTLRRDIARHGDDVINFTDYPIVTRQRGKKHVYWA